ncbi:MAG: nucleotidyltransferase family protein [Elusimicrobia bacterium]|nr:nucleotidyltransferase family protein [Elusimicrobiota bacterium]
MVLAAGVGSRLRPLTDGLPKALVEVGGRPMLERAIRAVVDAGADGVIVNVHHLADQVERFLRAASFPVPVELSREDALLDTGGGIRKAAWFLRDGRPFLVHNVDVVTSVDLRALYRAHLARPGLATLAVRDRPGRRRLLFGADGLLQGREGEGPAGGAAPLAFDGIHVLSPELLDRMPARDVFSITELYVRLAAAGEPVRAFRTDGSLWAEIGSPQRLAQARRLADEGRL